MVIKAFPDHSSADETGLLAIGGDLEIDSLLLAYRNGIFPWPLDEHLLTWFSPPQRAVLFLNEFHLSRSLKKALSRSAATIRVNTEFAQVIEACSRLDNRSGQLGTWITAEMIEAYIAFHHAGYAHSIEVFDGPGLVGGLYGVSIGQTFAGESMFFRHSNASKLALCFLVSQLQEQGVEWIDCQVMTPLFKSFGARTISREEFLPMVREASSKPGIILRSGQAPSTNL